MRLKVLVALAVVLAAVWGVMQARAVAGQTVHVHALLPPAVAARLVPAKLRDDVARLRAPATRAVESRSTNLGKAEALRDVVRAGMAPGTTDCFGYATTMLALGRSLGLPLKLVIGGAGYSNYDTHTTVSVWMPQYRHWGIVDPTFGGIWTWRGDTVPLRARALRDALVTGHEDQIVWRSSHGTNSTMPSDYYVDPIQLFRYVGTVAWDGRTTVPVTAPDSTMLFASTFVSHVLPGRSVPPTQTISAKRANRSGTAAQPASAHIPPPYARRLVEARTVRLPATLKTPAGSLVAWVSTPGATIAGYATASLDGGSLSPIFVRRSVKITGSGRARVLVYSVRQASPANER